MPILDKFRLEHFIYKQHKETTITGLHRFRRSESSHDLDSLLAAINNIHCYVHAISRQC